MQLSLSEALTGAQGKAAGVFSADLARLLLSATREDWEQMRWVSPPPVEQYLNDLGRLGEALILLWAHGMRCRQRHAGAQEPVSVLNGARAVGGGGAVRAGAGDRPGFRSSPEPPRNAEIK